MKKKQFVPKKANNKKSGFVSVKKFNTTMIAVFGLTIFIMSVGFISLFLFINKKEDTSSVSKIAYMVRQAVEGLYKEVPVASYSNTYFINEAEVTFEKSEVSQLVYLYAPANEYTAEYIQLSDKTLIDVASTKVIGAVDISETLDKIPQLQACARLFVITFKDSLPEYYSANYSLTTSKSLTDGRTAYIWRTTDQACSQFEYPDDDIVRVIESVESY